MIRLLFVSATPEDQDLLRIDREFQSIKDVVSRNDLIELESHFSASPNDLRTCLLSFKPDILHFSGHGGAKEAFFENENGLSHGVMWRDLYSLISLVSETKCVVLSSCYSREFVNFLEKKIPYVIGYNDYILDDSAIYFSRAFYEAMSHGKTIDEAYEFGENAIKINRSHSGQATRSIDANRDMKFDIPFIIKSGSDFKISPKRKLDFVVLVLIGTPIVLLAYLFVFLFV